MKAKVLIVGAGPTGLVTALTLSKLSVPFRIIDKKAGLTTESRAMAIVPGSLEHYGQIGLADAVVADAIKLSEGYFHTRDKVTPVDFDKISIQQSRYDAIYTYPQDEHEQLLYETLKAQGHEVEWETDLIDVIEVEDPVKVHLERPGQTRIENFDYVIGCDGGSSQVRKALGIEFEGDTYEELFYVSDVELGGDAFQRNAVHAFLNDGNFLLAFPLRNEKTTRLIGLFPESLVENETLDMAHLSPFLEETYQLNARSVDWFSTYKVHHRLAETFRKDNVFLAGDAAHIHSPVGGQGMNAGIGDAVNLAWKIAEVIGGTMRADLLDTYESERRAYAMQLVKTTDQAFKGIVYDQSLVNKIKEWLAPRAIKFVLNSDHAFKDKLIGTIMQLRIEYDESALTVDDAPLSGLRLPFYKSNRDLTDTMTWHLQVYGKVSEELARFLRSEYPDFVLHAFEWEGAMADQGFSENAAYLVRPDGYISWSSETQDVSGLKAFLKSWKFGEIEEPPKSTLPKYKLRKD